MLGAAITRCRLGAVRLYHSHAGLALRRGERDRE